MILSLFFTHTGIMTISGGTRTLVDYYGAKTIIGAPDVPFVNGSVDLTWASEPGFKFFQPFEPDITLNDGDVFELGKTKIRAVSSGGARIYL